MKLAPEVVKVVCSCGHTFHPNRTWAVGQVGSALHFIPSYQIIGERACVELLYLPDILEAS